MGANQSYETGFADDGTHAGNGDDGALHKRKKAKPAAPHRPAITAVTHNAISLTWLPPRHAQNAIIAYTVEIRRPQQAKQWLTLTKNCQGTHYEARHLDTNTEYAFRVRAENIYGTGKPSAPSDPSTTKIFESSSDLSCFITHTPASPVISPFSERRVPKSASYEGGLLENTDSVFDTSCRSSLSVSDIGMVKSPSLSEGAASTSSLTGTRQINQYGQFRRRHSFNVHLEGRIYTMLNHSDRFYSTNSLNSSTSTIVMNNRNSSGRSSTSNVYNNNNDTDNAKTRSSAILRNNINRTSLQPYRKSTIPILLPGTGSNSLNRLRESRASLKSSSSDITAVGGNGSISATSTPRHRSSWNTNSNRKSNQELRNSLGSTASDSNTTTSSASSSASNKEEYYGSSTAGQGSRLSLQSVLSDVTMSNHSQSSSDEPPSRPISFSDIGENTELGSFLSGSSFIQSMNRSPTNTTTNLSTEERCVPILDNEKSNLSTKCIDYYDNKCDSGNEEDDCIYNLRRDLVNMEITEEKLKFHDLKEKLKNGLSSDDICLNVTNNNNSNNNDNNNKSNVNQSEYYQSLDNPWEKDINSVSSVSEDIMAAPFSDDIKLAFNARNHGCSDVSSINGYGCRRSPTNQNWNNNNNKNHVIGDDRGERDDFRTLRSVLQSNNMIVKQSRSMPEVVGVVFSEGGETRTLTRGKLTTIEDEDEEEEAVRVTTL